MKPKKIKYEVTFELEDLKKFSESYPNFKYNYNSWEEWVQSTIDYMIGMNSDIEGHKITAKIIK